MHIYAYKCIHTYISIDYCNPLQYSFVLNTPHPTLHHSTRRPSPKKTCTDCCHQFTTYLSPRSHFIPPPTKKKILEKKHPQFKKNEITISFSFTLY